MPRAEEVTNEFAIDIIKYQGKYYMCVENFFDFFREDITDNRTIRVLDTMELPIRRAITQQEIKEVYNG